MCVQCVHLVDIVYIVVVGGWNLKGLCVIVFLSVSSCRRVDGIHHHKILNHEGIWRFEKAVSYMYVVMFVYSIVYWLSTSILGYNFKDMCHF